MTAGEPSRLAAEQSLAAVASTGLPPEDQLDVIGAVDDYVAGFVLKSDLEPGLASVPEEMGAEVTEYLKRELSGGDYPHVARFLGEDDQWGTLRRFGTAYTADRRFELGLDRLLDGIAAQITRSRRR